MINIEELWKKRLVQNIHETRKYLRYMLNDHLLFVLIFVIGGGAFYYQDWVKSLTNDFPYIFLLALALALVLTNSPIRTLLKEADMAYLLQIERRLTNYFRKAIFYSLLMQTYLIIIVFVAFLPIYNKFTDNSFSLIITYLGILIIVKLWNLFLRWKIQYFQDPKAHLSDTIVRFTLNFIFLYFLFAKANIFFLIGIGVLMVLLYGYFNLATQTKILKWEFLIEQEAKRMLLFYRIANLFTDVPKLKDRVKRRMWLDWTLSFIQYSKENTFSYLYLRTFLRTSDYLGLYVRLTIIGGFILYFAPFELGKLIVTVLFIYLTGFQLMTLWKHHDMKIWISLYPVSSGARMKSFVHFLMILLCVQAVLLSTILLINKELNLALLSLLLGLIFSFLFSRFYIQKKMKI